MIVSRRTYDECRSDLAAATARIKELTDIIVDMKVTGATLALRRPAIPDAKPKKDDIVAAAIERNPHAVRLAVRQSLERFAETQRALGKSDEEVVTMLAEYRIKPMRRDEDDDQAIDEDEINWDDPDTIPIFTTANPPRRKRG